MLKLPLGLTLTELIIALVLLSILIIILGTGYSFIYGRIMTNMRLQNIHLQIDYALENIRLHCISAIRIADGSLFTAGITNTKSAFQFQGESNIYNITPDNLTDDLNYNYRIDENGNLALSTQATTSTKSTIPIPPTEILMDKQYEPAVTFQYDKDAEPNFLTVTIEARSVNPPVSKTEGIRFWFTDVVR